MAALSPEELTELYSWVDSIPLSRTKRNISRDFSDGVLMAEVVHHFFPKLVELHNYSSAHSVSQKKYNWNTLNTKVFKKLRFSLTPKEISDLANSRVGAIEQVLLKFQNKMEEYKERRVQRKQTNGSNQSSPMAGNAPQSPYRSENQKSMGEMSPASKEGGSGSPNARVTVDSELLIQKEATINELKETIEILEQKVRKLEQLVSIKDRKISAMSWKLSNAGLS